MVLSYLEIIIIFQSDKHSNLLSKSVKGQGDRIPSDQITTDWIPMAKSSNPY